MLQRVFALHVGKGFPGSKEKSAQCAENPSYPNKGVACDAEIQPSIFPKTDRFFSIANPEEN
jgi:hypothetical protein